MNYKKKIKKRIFYLLLAIPMLFLIILFSLLSESNVITKIYNDELYGYLTGVSSGIILGVIVFTIRYIIALKNENYLKKLKVKESDERLLKIKNNANALTFKIVMITVGFLSIIVFFFNKELTYLCIGIIYFAVIVKTIVYFILNKYQ